MFTCPGGQSYHRLPPNLPYPADSLILLSLPERLNFSSAAGSPSAKNRALREELHSEKRSFFKCRRVPGTRERATLGKGPLPQLQHSGKEPHLGKKIVT